MSPAAAPRGCGPAVIANGNALSVSDSSVNAVERATRSVRWNCCPSPIKGKRKGLRGSWGLLGKGLQARPYSNSDDR